MPEPLSTIAVEWDGFERTVIERKLSPELRLFLRDTFFAGAGSMFDMVTRQIGDLSDAAAEAQLTALQAEIFAHIDDMLTRAARLAEAL